MKTVACPSCRHVNSVEDNAVSDAACVKCGEPLAGVILQQSIDELKRLSEKMHRTSSPAKSFYSFNGFGTTLLDYRALPDGTYEATRWVIALFLPVFPLSAYVIQPEAQEFGYGQQTSSFTILGKTNLSAARVLRTYMLAAVALLPVVLGFVYSSEINRAVRGLWAVGLMLLMAAWAIYIIFFKLKNDSKAYRSHAAARQETETT